MAKILLRDRCNPIIKDMDTCSVDNILCVSNGKIFYELLSCDFCGARYWNNNSEEFYVCTRKPNHKGSHIACSLLCHNLKTWN
jgi:hypothetical protein